MGPAFSFSSQLQPSFLHLSSMFVFSLYFCYKYVSSNVTRKACYHLFYFWYFCIYVFYFIFFFIIYAMIMLENIFVHMFK